MDTNELVIVALITTLAKAIVPDEGAVSVSHKLEEGVLVYTVRCNPADARFIIGKKGTNANAIRALAWAAGQKLGLPKVEVELDVPEKGTGESGAGGGSAPAPMPSAPSGGGPGAAAVLSTINLSPASAFA